MLQFLLIKPKFPVICDFDNFIIGAKYPKDFLKKIEGFEFPPDSQYDVIDATGKGWRFIPKDMLISPFSPKLRWTKKEIINLVNHRKNKSNAIDYPMKLHKKTNVIVTELVKLLDKKV